MKNISKTNKIILLLVVLLIIAGIITLFTTGFNKSLEYKSGTRIEVYIPQGYEEQDIINMASISFKEKEFIFEKVEKLNQVASIKIENYEEEELKKFKTSISEKYKIELEKLETHEISIPTTGISTDIKPYIFPILIVTVLSLIYMLLRNYKFDKVSWIILKILVILVLVLGAYFSIILVARIPYGSHIMPIALAIYIVTLITLVNRKYTNK